ncbi:MAG: glycine zipper 2TM domain-containing protein [Pseudomonadales bacterium]
MTSGWIKGIIVGSVVATAGGAIATSYSIRGDAIVPPPASAEVVKVAPATEMVSVPREVCEDVTITHQAEPRDKHKVLGTATGAVLGGLLGNQVGGGNGKKLATVAGAAAGAYAGRKAQEHAQADDTYTTTEQRCSTVAETVERTVGYDVTYRIGDEESQIRLEQDPGRQIPLVDGEIAI